MVQQYGSSEYAAYDHEWPTSDEKVKGIAKWFGEGDSFVAVCLRSTAKLIGFVSLSETHREGYLEYNLGYVFNSDYHGKGYATEGCQIMLAHAFETLGADAVVTGTASVNGPSCRLLERLGMRKTGESKGSFRKDSDGNPIEFDALAYGLTKEEWA